MNDDSISIIPEIRRLHLTNVGPWEDASFEFSPHINIIRNHDRGGCGKSMIFRALVSPTNEYLKPRGGADGGTVKLEYAGTVFRYQLPPPLLNRTDSQSLSAGEKIMDSLRQALQQTQSGCCLCIEAEVFGCLDATNRAEAIEMVNRAQCQFIIITPRAVDLNRFRSPRIFECDYDIKTESSSVQVSDL